MANRLLAPRWLAIHLAALALVAGCGLLGRWQLDRAAQFRQSAGGAERAPVPIQTLTHPTGALSGKAVDRLVSVTGSYDAGHTYLVPGHQLGRRNGSWVLSIVRIAGGDGVLVVRGWLPGGASAVVLPPAPTGAVTVTGRLSPSEDPGGGLPPGTTLASNEIPAVNPVDLIERVPYPLYDGYVILRSQRPPADPSLTLVPSPKLGNDVPGFYFQHLAYVALWWLFGAFVVFFWWRLIRDDRAAS